MLVHTGVPKSGSPSPASSRGGNLARSTSPFVRGAPSVTLRADPILNPLDSLLRGLTSPFGLLGLVSLGSMSMSGCTICGGAGAMGDSGTPSETGRLSQGASVRGSSEEGASNSTGLYAPLVRQSYNKVKHSVCATTDHYYSND